MLDMSIAFRRALRLNQDPPSPEDSDLVVHHATHHGRVYHYQLVLTHATYGTSRSAITAIKTGASHSQITSSMPCSHRRSQVVDT